MLLNNVKETKKCSFLFGGVSFLCYLCTRIPQVWVSLIKKYEIMKRFRIKTVKDVMRFMFWVIVEKEYKLYSNGTKLDGNGFEPVDYYEALLDKADKVLREKKALSLEALAWYIEYTLLVHV